MQRLNLERDPYGTVNLITGIWALLFRRLNVVPQNNEENDDANEVNDRENRLAGSRSVFICNQCILLMALIFTSFCLTAYAIFKEESNLEFVLSLLSPQNKSCYNSQEAINDRHQWQNFSKYGDGI